MHFYKPLLLFDILSFAYKHSPYYEMLGALLLYFLKAFEFEKSVEKLHHIVPPKNECSQGYIKLQLFRVIVKVLSWKTFQLQYKIHSGHSCSPRIYN